MFNKLSLLAVLALAAVGQAKYDTPDNLPAKTDSKGGQIGYNDCRKRYGESSQKSMCQNAYINSIKDFCLWGPPKAGSTVGDTEAIEVAWCLKSGYGTRLIPNGAIKGASRGGRTVLLRLRMLTTPSFLRSALFEDTILRPGYRYRRPHQDQRQEGRRRW